MLSPITNIVFGTRFKKIQCKNANKTVSKKPYTVNSLWDKNNISFTHYISVKPEIKLDNNIVNNPWYYKLPVKTLDDGSFFEFMPDKTQKDCARNIVNGDSLVYCAPTGTGKTAVAHFSTSVNQEKGKKTIITVPLIALANDKFDEFQKIYGKDRTGLLTGTKKLNTNAPISIMTAEILYNQAHNLKYRQKEIGSIIFDEAHYLNDEERGNVWENAIIAASDNNIQLLCLSATIGNDEKFASWINSLNKTKNAPLVKLSSKERHVPLSWKIYSPDGKGNNPFKTILDYKTNLKDIDENNLSERQKRALRTLLDKQEFDKIDKNEYKNALSDLRQKLSSLQFSSLKDFKNALKNSCPYLDDTSLDEVSYLLSDTNTKYLRKIHQPKVEEGNDYTGLIKDLKNQDMLPALIFKLSIRQSDEIAAKIADSGLNLTTDKEKEQIKEIIEKYKKEGYYLGCSESKNGLSDKEYNMLLEGCASHNSAKLDRHKKLIEELFSKKLLKVVVATSTLSAGINMPTRTVVLSDTKYMKYTPDKGLKRYPLSVNDFHQMAGRAGRRGIDKVGNVVLYNLETSPYGFAKNDEHPEETSDELLLAYKLLMSEPDKLRSHFKPDPVVLARHYEDHSTIPRDLINKSFKVFSSPNPEKTRETLEKRFANYTNIVLKKQGFVTKDFSEKIAITPKGKILENCQGANPLLVASLMYDEKLKNIKPIQLVQVAGYIAGSNNQGRYEEELHNDIIATLKKLAGEEEAVKFDDVKKIVKNKEDKILKSLKEAKVPTDDIITSDSFSALVAYLFAYLNENQDNPIVNFEQIVREIRMPIHPKIENDWGQNFNRRVTQGGIYKAIVQTITVLKQISRTCDYALMEHDVYTNKKYWQNLKKNTEKAIALIDKPPIDEAL